MRIAGGSSSGLKRCSSPPAVLAGRPPGAGGALQRGQPTTQTLETLHIQALERGAKVRYPMATGGPGPAQGRSRPVPLVLWKARQLAQVRGSNEGKPPYGS